MAGKLKATNSIKINTSVERAWQALTDPDIITQYMFSTTVTSDWKLGSAITYTGEWEGKHYEDKGQIIDVIPFQHLHTTYWSGMSGKPDAPENYVNVYYDVARDDDAVLVTITQDGIEDDAGVAHMNSNWIKVLEGMKQVLEGDSK